MLENKAPAACLKVVMFLALSDGPPYLSQGHWDEGETFKTTVSLWDHSAYASRNV